MRRRCLLVVALSVAAYLGCSAHGVGNPRDLASGTSGTLTLNGKPCADLQVNVFADATPPKRLGYGVTNSEGVFTLIADDGKGPFKLTAGKYRITLESVSADPIPIPPAVSDVAKTPLVKDWTASESKLEVSVP